MVIIYPLISVLFGFLLVLVFKANRNHLVKLLLPFSGAFILSLGGILSIVDKKLRIGIASRKEHLI